MTHRRRFGLRGVSLPLLCPLPGQNERAEGAAVLHLSALATELVSALGSVSTGAVFRTSIAIVSPTGSGQI
jgi:hypothetical protein